MHSLMSYMVPRRSQTCYCNNEKFLPGMDYFSVLFQDEEENNIRRDYCVNCWKSEKVVQSLPSQHTYWKSCTPKKETSLPSTRSQRILEIIKQLLSQPIDNEKEIFVLSLYLQRARIIALRKEMAKEDGSYFLFEIIAEEEFMTVKSMVLSPTEINEIQKKLSLQLQTPHGT